MSIPSGTLKRDTLKATFREVEVETTAGNSRDPQLENLDILAAPRGMIPDP